MPTAAEAVVNKALSGAELKEILRAKFDLLLDNEGLLSHYLAYGRIAYDIGLWLHLDNPMRPESEIHAASRATSDIPAMSSAPLASPSSEAVVSGEKVSGKIDSPNAERLRHGLPLPVVTKGPDGTIQTEMVKYPPQPELGPGDVTLTDTSKEARAAWKLPEPTP